MSAGASSMSATRPGSAKDSQAESRGVDVVTEAALDRVYAYGGGALDPPALASPAPTIHCAPLKTFLCV
jgi:hypothetical protein